MAVHSPRHGGRNGPQGKQRREGAGTHILDTRGTSGALGVRGLLFMSCRARAATFRGSYQKQYHPSASKQQHPRPRGSPTPRAIHSAGPCSVALPVAQGPAATGRRVVSAQAA